MRDVFVDAVAMPVMMVVMVVLMVMGVVVIMRMIMVMAFCAACLLIQRIAKLCMMMMDLNLAFGEPILEGRHKIDTVAQTTRLRFANAFHECIQNMVLIGQIMRLQKGDIRCGFRNAVDVSVDAADQLA